ncbi:MAG: SusF/SusE family outer membrane protein [Chitinophagaceae bacterium]
MKRILLSIITLAVTIAGCKKTDFDLSSTGEGLGSFSITGPESGTVLNLNSATPNTGVEISWTAAKPGLNTAPTYAWIAALRTGGSLDNPILEYPADNGGKATKLTLNYKMLDDFLKLRNIPEGAAVELVWTIVATNGETKIRSNDAFFITLRRFADGVSPFSLLAPVNSTATNEISPSSTSDSVKFIWQKAVAGKPANGLTYKIQFAGEAGDFSTPLFESPSNNNGLDTIKAWSYKDFSDALTTAGYTDLGAVVKLKWRVVATSGTATATSVYTNEVAYLREVKIYLVGGSTPAGWEPANAIQMIPDAKFPSVYYIYVHLNAGGGGLKFLNQKQWPGGDLNATDWGMKKGAPGDLAADDEDNVPVPADGVYRVSVDLKNNKYYVQADHGRMGTVGDATNAGWNPPGVFPTQGMAYIKPNRFLGILDFKGGGFFKMIDGSSWPDGGGPVNQSKDFGKGASAGVMLAENEGNFDGPATAGMYRVIWDGTDVKNLKYEIGPGIMKIVGDALTDYPAWNPGGSPQMNYEGNGVWKFTLKLTGGKDFKFLAGADWGALDYEDAGSGKIKYEGGDNFKSPATSGTYQVILDEYKGTIQLVQQ